MLLKRKPDGRPRQAVDKFEFWRRAPAGLVLEDAVAAMLVSQAEFRRFWEAMVSLLAHEVNRSAWASHQPPESMGQFDAVTRTLRDQARAALLGVPGVELLRGYVI